MKPTHHDVYPIRFVNLLVAAFLTATASVGPMAKGATIDWIAGAPGGVYSDGASWSGGVVPGAADTARFNIPGVYQAVFFDFTGDRTLFELEVLQGRPVFALGAGTVNDPFLLSPTAVTVASGATLAFSGGVEMTTFNFDVAGTFEVGDFVPGSSTADKTITINDANVSLQDGALIRLFNGTDATFTGGLNTLVNAQAALLVDGSTLHTGTSNTANSSWGGQNLGHFDLDIVNGSTATFNHNTIFMGADDGSVDARVSGGSTVTSNSLNLGAASSSPGESVLVNVDGAGSTWAQNGASTLTIGSSSANGSSSLVLSDQGVFNTGTGLTTINASGTLSVNTDGTTGGVFNAGGNVFVVGGTINSVEATGIASINSFNLAAGKTLMASDDAQLVFTGDYDVVNGTTFNITDGADWSLTQDLDIGTTTDGSVVVDEAGSTLTVGGNSSSFGLFGATGSLTLRNQATATFDSDVFVGGNGTGTANIESGADLILNSVLRVGNSSGSGTLTVTGSGSTVTQNGNAAIIVGNNSLASLPRTVTVSDNAVFTTGTGNTEINRSGTLNLNTDGTSGGVFNANGNVIVNGGTINSVQAFFSPNVLNLAAGKTLTASDNAQLVFTGDYRVVNGTTFNITDGADWSLTHNLDIGSTTDGSVIVDGAGSTLTVGGFESTFGLFNATGSLTLLNEATATFDSEVSILTGTANIESGADLILNSGLSVAGNSTLSVTGGGSTVTQNGNRAIFVGTTLGAGTITVSDTAVFTTGTSFMQINANGTLVLDNGGTFNANGNVIVDGGTLDEQAGGDFNLADNLALSVLDDGQVSLTSGFASQGSTINISRGGDLTSSTFFNIARNATVTVDGVGSTFTTNTANATLLNWGSFGNENARLNILNGGTATLNANLNLGFGNNGTQDATIDVQSGGTLVMNGQARVGMGLTGDGTLNVDGAGSTATVTGSNVMNIGDNGAGATGTGTVNLTNGGTLTAPTVNVNTTGVVNLTGGNLDAETINHINGGGFSFSDGTLTVDAFQGDLVQSGGTLTPGDSAGLTSITGDYDLNAGALELEIGGTNPGIEHDRVEVTGFATLLGDLDVSLIDGFTPSEGESYGFLFASGGFDVNFAAINLPDLSGMGLDWQLNPGGSTVFLDVIAAALSGDFNDDGLLDCMDVDALVGEIAAGTHDSAFDLTGDNLVDLADRDAWLAAGGAANLPSGNPYLLGDANLDGVVDGQDFIAWNSNKFTALAAWCSGDFSADGVVDGQDFIIWNSNKFTSSDGVSAVPEPSAGVFAIFTLIGLVALRRRCPA